MNRLSIRILAFWLFINDQFERCISSMTFRYFNNLSPLYMNDVFKPAGKNTSANRTSLNWKTNHGQKRFSYVAPIIFKELPDFSKTTENLSTYNHIVKKHSLFFARQTIRKRIIIATSNQFWDVNVFTVVIIIIIIIVWGTWFTWEKNSFGIIYLLHV